MDIILSLVVLSALALVAGAIALWRRGSYRKQALLMLVLAAVMAANVAIWALPSAGGGSAPIDKAREIDAG